MKIICGILPQTNGDVYLDGSPLTRQELTNIGSLIESPPTYNHLSAQDNLKVVALNENIDFSEIPKVLDLVNLDVDPKKKVKNFSLGTERSPHNFPKA